MAAIRNDLQFRARYAPGDFFVPGNRAPQIVATASDQSGAGYPRQQGPIVGPIQQCMNLAGKISGVARQIILVSARMNSSLIQLRGMHNHG